MREWNRENWALRKLVGATNRIWSDYINTNVNLAVASLEDLNGEEAPTGSSPFLGK